MASRVNSRNRRSGRSRQAAAFDDTASCPSVIETRKSRQRFSPEVILSTLQDNDDDYTVATESSQFSRYTQQVYANVRRHTGVGHIITGFAIFVLLTISNNHWSGDHQASDMEAVLNELEEARQHQEVSRDMESITSAWEKRTLTVGENLQSPLGLRGSAGVEHQPQLKLKAKQNLNALSTNALAGVVSQRTNLGRSVPKRNLEQDPSTKALLQGVPPGDGTKVDPATPVATGEKVGPMAEAIKESPVKQKITVVGQDTPNQSAGADTPATDQSPVVEGKTNDPKLPWTPADEPPKEGSTPNNHARAEAMANRDVEKDSTVPLFKPASPLEQKNLMEKQGPSEPTKVEPPKESRAISNSKETAIETRTDAEIIYGDAQKKHLAPTRDLPKTEEGKASQSPKVRLVTTSKATKSSETNPYVATKTTERESTSQVIPPEKTPNEMEVKPEGSNQASSSVVNAAPEKTDGSNKSVEVKTEPAEQMGKDNTPAAPKQALLLPVDKRLVPDVDTSPVVTDQKTESSKEIIPVTEPQVSGEKEDLSVAEDSKNPPGAKAMKALAPETEPAAREQLSNETVPVTEPSVPGKKDDVFAPDSKTPSEGKVIKGIPSETDPATHEQPSQNLVEKETIAGEQTPEKAVERPAKPEQGVVLAPTDQIGNIEKPKDPCTTTFNTISADGARMVAVLSLPGCKEGSHAMEGLTAVV